MYMDELRQIILIFGINKKYWNYIQNIDIKKYSTTVENSDFSPSHINKERYPEMNQEIIQSVSFL